MTPLLAAAWCESVFKVLGKKRLAHVSEVRQRCTARANGLSVHFWSCCLVSKDSCQDHCADDAVYVVDKLREKKTRLRCDTELATRQLARVTTLEPINRAEYTSWHTSAENGHSCENWRGHCAWTRTLPVDAEACSVGTQSFPAL